MKRLSRGIRIWLPRFLSRLNLYLFYMSLIVFSLYLVGNFQRFSDDSLRLLFRIMDLYFYSYLVLALGNLLIYTLLVKEKTSRRILFFINTFSHAALIFALYLLTNLLSAFFRGV